MVLVPGLTGQKSLAVITYHLVNSRKVTTLKKRKTFLRITHRQKLIMLQILYLLQLNFFFK